jgi:hypothetical protein
MTAIAEFLLKESKKSKEEEIAAGSEGDSPHKRSATHFCGIKY